MSFKINNNITNITNSITELETNTFNKINTTIYLATFYGLSESNSGIQNKLALDNVINDCINNNGGIVLIPSGTYKCDNLNPINGDFIIIQGVSGTKLATTSITGNFIEFIGQHSGIENITITGEYVKMINGYAITFLTTCFQNICRNIRIEFMYNGILLNNTDITILDNISIEKMLGIYGIHLLGQSILLGQGPKSCRIKNLYTNNPYPILNPTTNNVKIWNNNTNFNLGDIIYQNNKIYQCSKSGISNISGSGPNIIPGENGLQVFNIPINDGTVEWKFISQEIIWLLMDQFTLSCNFNNISLLNGYIGLKINSIGTNVNNRIVVFNGLEIKIEKSFLDCIQLIQGKNFYLTQSLITSSLTNNGIFIDQQFNGQIVIGKGSLISNNAKNGILLENGPINTNITGTQIGLNSQSSPTTYHGINVGVGAERFNIINNQIGTLTTGSGIQGYGIFVDIGGSDHYIITNNALGGNATGAYLNGGTGLDQVLTNNITG